MRYHGRRRSSKAGCDHEEASCLRRDPEEAMEFLAHALEREVALECHLTTEGSLFEKLFVLDQLLQRVVERRRVEVVADDGGAVLAEVAPGRGIEGAME